jgi:DNA-binding transcriptional ArsR family regulator
VEVALDTAEKIKMKKELTEKAEFFKTISHPVRLCILALLLRNEDSNVTNMQCCIDVSQSTVSQHLAKLKMAGIITGRREGTEIFYSIANEQLAHTLQIILENVQCKGESK